jgi:hypothetical protein
LLPTHAALRPCSARPALAVQCNVPSACSVSRRPPSVVWHHIVRDSVRVRVRVRVNP